MRRRAEDAGRAYAAIDLKSFYASVECMERGLDPLRTCLVVADASRTDKTICLAVSPALKAYRVPARPRLFEVRQILQEVNAARRYKAPGRKLEGASADSAELEKNPSLAADFVIAVPQMAKYMEISRRIYGIYLRHIAPEDIHAYSIDEVFIDLHPYLLSNRMTPHEMVVSLLREVVRETGITATAGIGTNLYLAKAAMDIMAKKMSADEDGVRIAELDEETYRRELWTHQPLTDFWRVGKGTARKLAENGLYTMGDIAATMLDSAPTGRDERMMFRLFGVNAELLIDHAWGVEPCTIADIKAYRSQDTSVVSGQVLQEPYTFDKARIVAREMAESVAIDLRAKGLVTKRIVLIVGYDAENLKGAADYQGEVKIDRYGRKVPKHARGTQNLSSYTALSNSLIEHVTRLYERITDRTLLVRRLTIAATQLRTGEEAEAVQREMDLFAEADGETADAAREEKEQRIDDAVLAIKQRFGKNSVLRGTNLLEGATQRDRNQMIGGHKA
ncbi:DNA methylase [Selenomonas sp. TAMA-11512]|uniref:Y-family DNA polymerase n=1 Tax=Selenomonas sp. TAMA-11512 TaxID=3095337 RepID=UPI00308A7FD0|nr:DNA methylase [Selenomonas sp. TAMA-11512]